MEANQSKRTERKLGKTRWVIAEGFIPPPGPYEEDRALRSHETACLLNTTSQPAQVDITIYFSDREPIGPYRVAVEPRRTKHLRFDELEDPEPIPRETDYSSVIESDVPIVVQHTRLDARLGTLSLMSSTAYGAE